MHFNRSPAMRSRATSILLATLALVAPAHGQNADTGIVPLLAASSDPLHQGFVRVVNRSDGGGGCYGYRPHDNGWGRGDRPVINVN